MFGLPGFSATTGFFDGGVECFVVGFGDGDFDGLGVEAAVAVIDPEPVNFSSRT
jgi:hypothetical protein